MCDFYEAIDDSSTGFLFEWWSIFSDVYFRWQSNYEVQQEINKVKENLASLNHYFELNFFESITHSFNKIYLVFLIDPPYLTYHFLVCFTFLSPLIRK